MKLVRRGFLKWSLLQGAVLQLPALANATESFVVERKNGPSILQGATDETSTQFSIVYDRQTPLAVFALDEAGNTIHPDSTEIITYQDHPLCITKAYFSQLSMDTNYTLRLYTADLSQGIDEREFKTLNTKKDNIRFAICSCMDDQRHEPGIWKDLVSQDPDLIFFVGDSVYSDKENKKIEKFRAEANPDRLWRRFTEARQTLEIFYSKKLIPLLATWDDHDFGGNDTDNSYPFIVESQKNFTSFYAQSPSHCRFLTQGPGISSALIFNSQIFVLLDDRSFRQPKDSHSEFAHWGEEQNLWMFDILRNHKGFGWLMNGSQIFPAMVFKESVSQDHKQQLQKMTSELKNIATKVAFVSGDVHYSEISKIEKKALGYETYEITSSSIHSEAIPGVPFIVPNPRRIASTGKRNYILVDAVATDTGAEFSVTSHSAQDKTNFSKDLVVS